jgi:hypothetical protein
MILPSLHYYGHLIGIAMVAYLMRMGWGLMVHVCECWVRSSYLEGVCSLCSHRVSPEFKLNLCTDFDNGETHYSLFIPF